MSTIDDELLRVKTALSDAQSALAAVRAERDGAIRDAEAAHRQRHAFLAGLAHDLRNPLAPLSNGIELLRLTDNDPAGRLRTRGIMERQVGNLMRIADELSDLARLSGDHSTLQRASFDPGEVLRGLADRLEPTLRAQEMTLQLDTASLPRLRGDAPRIAQAVGHLVDDIVRHTERGSTIRIAASREGQTLALTIATAADLDEDAGGSPRPLEDVDVAALGLGVALALQLSALHGGGLRGRRPPGARRARFTLTLPVDASAAAEASPASASPAQPATGEPALSVLLADDNIDFSHSFGTMLELLGHRVEVVHDGLSAVASIVGSPPDIAFVDIGMPSLDGVETVRRVRGQGNTQDVVLVAVTGRGGAEDRARAAEAGFDRYLVKPFAMQDVRDALDAAQAVRSGAVARVPGGFASTRVA
ncbi:hybrid sensor histidine kinase/response regulator [Scleromatobacter humisilvae]|uniref:histidine kinase n=1 Tax=Scleromatobacter humisilvae TaxID=2897159 RepID=A0A9X1YHR5_9BURK|nr:hybrid sensor histidine kinase/response regulator [Scleromatobacter humisilvae]MCK9686126.1 hybrid sensor histidine kinase/response regulator [Scleromatobacter humisilvae]